MQKLNCYISLFIYFLLSFKNSIKETLILFVANKNERCDYTTVCSKKLQFTNKQTKFLFELKAIVSTEIFSYVDTHFVFILP